MPSWPPRNLFFFVISTSDRDDLPRIIVIALFHLILTVGLTVFYVSFDERFNTFCLFYLIQIKRLNDFFPLHDLVVHVLIHNKRIYQLYIPTANEIEKVNEFTY